MFSFLPLEMNMDRVRSYTGNAEAIALKRRLARRDNPGTGHTLAPPDIIALSFSTRTAMTKASREAPRRQTTEIA